MRSRYEFVRSTLDADSCRLMDQLRLRFRQLDVERLKTGEWCVYVTAGPTVMDEPLRLSAIGKTLAVAAARMIDMCRFVEEDPEAQREY